MSVYVLLYWCSVAAVAAFAFFEHVRCQYLYFCPSKGVSIGTFVLVLCCSSVAALAAVLVKVSVYVLMN